MSNRRKEKSDSARKVQEQLNDSLKHCLHLRHASNNVYIVCYHLLWVALLWQSAKVKEEWGVFDSWSSTLQGKIIFPADAELYMDSGTTMTTTATVA